MGEYPGKGARQPSDQSEQFPLPKPVMTGLRWHHPDSGTDRSVYLWPMDRASEWAVKGSINWVLQ